MKQPERGSLRPQEKKLVTVIELQPMQQKTETEEDKKQKQVVSEEKVSKTTTDEVKSHCLDLIFSSAQICEYLGRLTSLILFAATASLALIAFGDFSCAIPAPLSYRTTLLTYTLVNWTLFFVSFILLFLSSVNPVDSIPRRCLLFISKICSVFIPLFQMIWFGVMTNVFFSTIVDADACQWVLGVGYGLFVLTLLIALFCFLIFCVTICIFSGRLTCRCQCCMK